jgi:hypothetical protein
VRRSGWIAPLRSDRQIVMDECFAFLVAFLSHASQFLERLEFAYLTKEVDRGLRCP